VAPIKIKDNAFVAAGSTISKNVGIDDFSIARAQQKIIKKGRKKFLK
jgi:N-acetylglucosamine-1-phosphate uridyltransferase (contains nucleotidyltransferase and I-patch acetyltransferase domains)